MGVNVKGGMYCQRCDRPVAGQKSTHRARGAAGIATGLWPLAIGDPYHCPHCGGPVVPEWAANQAPGQLALNRAAIWIVVACGVLVVIFGR